MYRPLLEAKGRIGEHRREQIDQILRAPSIPLFPHLAPLTWEDGSSATSRELRDAQSDEATSSVNTTGEKTCEHESETDFSENLEPAEGEIYFLEPLFSEVGSSSLEEFSRLEEENHGS